MDVHSCTPPGPIAWGMNPPMRRLSSTVMRRNRRWSSGTCAMPSSTMRWDGVATRLVPSICMLPHIGRIGLAGAVGADHRDRLAGDLASLTASRTGSEYGKSQRTTTATSDWCRSADRAVLTCMKQKWRSATRSTCAGRTPPYDGRCNHPLAALKLQA
jgi:hypothetical protein